MTNPKPPKHLSREAKAWWRKLNEDYALNDQAARLLLQTSLEAFDRMRQAQKILEAEGPTFLDRFDQLKAHPLCTIERDSRAAMMAALKALNLDLEPLNDGPGRPPGR